MCTFADCPEWSSSQKFFTPQWFTAWCHKNYTAKLKKFRTRGNHA